ncbi:MAG: substrate-binding domain-containing protein, partial [Phycisphaerae bacterium]|nr:substrate-binding domain-containing protein [Phycisphaerae bacterium]
MLTNSLKITITALLISMVVFSCSPKEHGTIRVSGSTTIAPFMKKAAKDFSKNRDMTVEVNAIGSKAGIDALIAGKCDIAMSSMEILPEQIAAAKEKGINIKPFLLGYDIIIPIVHPSNEVSNISITDLKDIFAKKTMRWSALGGTDTPIDVVDR